MTLARNLMKKPIRIAKKSTISEVIKKLLEAKISRLVVFDGEKPAGIVTEKDVGRFLYRESSAKSLDKIPLDRIMQPIEYIDGMEHIQKCAKVMIDKKISSLAVGNENNLEGIFTKTDLTQFYAENFAGKKKIVDFMTRDYVSTHTAAPLARAIEKMYEHNISRMIIKNQNNEPVGVVSLRDFFKISLDLGSVEGDFEDHSLLDKIKGGFLSKDGFGDVTLAGDVMTKGIISIKFNEYLDMAAKVMLENGVNGLVVLDGNESVAGIISKTDITRVLSLSN